MQLRLQTLMSMLLLFVLPVNACTDVVLKALDNTVMVGRTMEFGPDLHSSIYVSPRGTEVTNTTPKGKQAMSWQSKYGYVFVDYFGEKKPVDGMNEKGLSLGALYLPDYTEYNPMPDSKEGLSHAMSYINFMSWVLGQFDSVNELKKALPGMTVYANPLAVLGQKNVVFPLHVIVTDRTGESIVVEWVKGKTHVYDNKIGVLTNSPTFDWHKNNLKNYLNLTPYAPNPVIKDGINYSVNGQGEGMFGLPGDYSPPSRFTKMAILLNTIEPPKTKTDALVLSQHILKNVFIPKGVVRGKKGDVNDKMDSTQWTVHKDLTNTVFYFSSYDFPMVQSIDLKKIDFSKGKKLKAIAMAKPSQQSRDITQSLYK